MKVLVGSQNPVKAEAVKEAFSKYFDDVVVVSVKVNSKVSDQPVSDETFEGAQNRAFELKKINEEKNLGADFFVGIEGGITNMFSKWFAFGGMCVVDKQGKVGFGASPHFELPDGIMKEILNGTELGDVMEKITGDNNIKQKAGAIGIFTKGVMNRKDLYVSGLIVAIVPFINRNLYFREEAS